MLNVLHSIVNWFFSLGPLAWLFVITIVIFFHELGHFLVARACGVKVEVFSLGFGKEIVGRTDKHGTRWRISWLPIGGYVKFFGDADAASTPDRDVAERTPEERAVMLQFKPLWQRALVVAAGPFANFLLAIVVFSIVLGITGRVIMAPVVGRVFKDSPAAMAGLRPGDIIQAIDGRNINDFGELRDIVSLSGGRVLAFRVERQGKPVTLEITPKLSQMTDPIGGRVKSFAIGLENSRNARLTEVRYGPISAVVAGTHQTWAIISGTMTYIWQMVTGVSDTSQLRGPAGTAAMAQKFAELGFLPLVNLLAFFSVSIGLLNLFPIPLLDGGHLLYYACEAVLGRPLGVRAQEVGFRLGLALVLGLMILATWNDVVR